MVVSDADFDADSDLRDRGLRRERRVEGFQSFDDLVDAVMAVTPSFEQSSPPPVEAFVSDYGSVATREVTEACELGYGKPRQTLRGLTDDGVMRRESRGNGSFWRPESGGTV